MGILEKYYTQKHNKREYNGAVVPQCEARGFFFGFLPDEELRLKDHERIALFFLFNFS